MLLVNKARRRYGTATAQFDDAPKSPPGATVIGCDGACSKVGRALLPDGCDNKRLPVRCLGATAVFPASVARPMRALDPFFMQMGDKSQDVFLFVPRRAKQ